MINNTSTSVTPGVLQPVIPPPPSLLFEEESGADFTFKMSAYNWTHSSTITGILETSTDGNMWTPYDVSMTVNSVNGKLYLRGSNISYFSYKYNNTQVNKSTIQLKPDTARIKCSGNIETLLDWQTVANGEHPIMDNYCFASLFENCKALIQCPSLTSITEVKQYCFTSMFMGCSNLQTIPKLQVLQMQNYCYATMFRNCTSIKLSKTQTGEYQTPYRIPWEGEGITFGSSNATMDMFVNTSGSFYYTPQVNTTYYTSNEIV